MIDNKISQQGIDMTMMVNRDELKNWIKSQFSGLRDLFCYIGNIGLGIWGFYICYELFCFLLALVINVYTLNKVFGFSWYLLTALFNGLATAFTTAEYGRRYQDLVKVSSLPY